MRKAIFRKKKNRDEKTTTSIELYHTNINRMKYIQDIQEGK